MSPLEKMARAIATVGDGNDEGWRNYLPEARAALLAIREPDEGMQNAGVEAASNIFGGWADEGQVIAYHHAMIDAILNQEPRP